MPEIPFVPGFAVKIELPLNHISEFAPSNKEKSSLCVFAAPVPLTKEEPAYILIAPELSCIEANAVKPKL